MKIAAAAWRFRRHELSRKGRREGLPFVEAFSAIEESTQKRLKKLLVVSADSMDRENIASLVAADDLEIMEVQTAGEALAVVKHQYLDGIVIDLKLEDIGALYVLVEEIRVG